MPGVAVHLSVAKRYIEKHKNEIMNVRDFYDGNILPDMQGDKEDTHYGSRKSNDLITKFREKIDIKKFLEKNTLDNDINRGKYLHLVTDWEYYNNFLPLDYLKTVSSFEYSKDITFTSSSLDNFLIDRYKLTTDMISVWDELLKLLEKWEQEEIEKYGQSPPDGRMIYSEQEIVDFIERISNTNIPG